jgi:uncharacterized protein YihD (DUF1040 family)
MAKLTNKQVIDLVNQEFEDAMGTPGGDLSKERALAMRYYQRGALGNEEKANSKAVTSDVMEVIDGIMPPLMRMFTSKDNLLTFDGHNPSDELAAEQESDYVSHVFFKKNPAFEIIFFWCFDALLQKVGYVKSYWDEFEDVTTEQYKGLTEEELLGLMEDDELEAVEREERTETVSDGLGNQVAMPVHDVKFRRVRKQGVARVVNVPPDELRISADANRLDPSSARMVGHERYVTRGELLEMGFDKKIVNDLPAEAVSVDSTEKSERKSKSDDRKIQQGENQDKSQDNILLREGYIHVDMDGDGRAELKQVYSANGVELEISDFDRQPFHALCSSPLPHKHVGMATAEKVMDNQLITSTLLRQILDNLYHTNNPGHAVWEQGIGEGTMDALLTRKIGSVTTFARPVGESYQAMPVPFTAGASFPMLEYFDKVKRDRTGVASDSESLKPDALKHIQQSVMMQVLDTNKAKIELIARIFAETGFKTLFLHLHELILKHQQKEEIVKLRGTYVPVNPQEWRTRRDMTVNIGLGIGTREQNLLHLEAIWAKQREMVEGGGMNLTVTPRNIFNTASEIVKNANLKEPQMFFTDPGDQKAPPPSDQQLQLQQQQQEIEKERNRLDAERNQINQAKVQLEAQKQQIDAQLEMMKLKEKVEEREDKFAAENEKLRNELIDMQMKMENNDKNRDLEELKVTADAELKSATAMKARAETAKIMAESDAQDIENAATESNIVKLVEDGGPSES